MFYNFYFSTSCLIFFFFFYVINQVILDIIEVVFHTYLILNNQIINQNRLICVLSSNR